MCIISTTTQQNSLDKIVPLVSSIIVSFVKYKYMHKHLFFFCCSKGDSHFMPS